MSTTTEGEEICIKCATSVKKNKFGAHRTLYDGTWYDSKKEAQYAMKLDYLKKAGEIKDWDRQIVFSLDVNKVHICRYILDFKIYYEDRIEYIDVKGHKAGAAYEIFRLKKKLMLACHGIDVIEI